MGAHARTRHHQTPSLPGAGHASPAHRFVLTNSLPDENSGWNIYLTAGTTHFRSLVLGDHLLMITPSGTHAVR